MTPPEDHNDHGDMTMTKNDASIAAGVFKTVKDAGALVLSATNEKELQEQLDFIMGNKILLEK